MTTFQSELERRFKLQNEYLGDNKPVNQIQPLVSVSCPTYQHGPYIRQCIEGFLMQQTTFPIEIIIGEDGSSDETADICKEYAEKYPNLIRLFLRDRCLSHYYDDEGKSGGRYNGLWCRMSARGKYLAICEGDDYWIDPLKLQKQVDYLVNHPEYGMCYSRCTVYNQRQNKFSNDPFGGPFVSFENLIKNNCIPTLTVLAKKQLMSKYLDENHSNGKNWQLGDYPMWLWFSYNSKIKFMDEISGVYRKLVNSASNSDSILKRESFLRSVSDIKAYFSSLYGNPELYDKDCLFGTLHMNAVEFGDFVREKEYYKLIKHPSFNQRMKHLICCVPFLYRLLGGRIFYVVD